MVGDVSGEEMKERRPSYELERENNGGKKNMKFVEAVNRRIAPYTTPLCIHYLNLQRIMTEDGKVVNEFCLVNERPPRSSAGTDRSTRDGSRDLLSTTVYPEKHSRKEYAFCLFACLLQIIVAIALLTFAGFRFRRIFERPSRIVGFEKPQEEISTASTSIVAILSGSSLLVPALLHVIAAMTATWPILPNFSSPLQLLYMISSSFSIVVWINGICAIAFELNIHYVQLNELYNSFMYRAYIILLTMASIDVLLIPTVGIIYAAYEHTSSAYHKRSSLHSIAAMFSILFSVAAMFLSVSCLFFTAKNLHQWNAVNNAVSFHLFGLRELIVSSYSLVVSVFGFSITLTTSRRLRSGVVILYSVCLLVILVYFANGERIFSVVENFRALKATHLESTLLPVTAVPLISTYVLICLMAVSHAANIAITVTAINASKVAKRCSALDKLPPYLQFRQRSPS